MANKEELLQALADCVVDMEDEKVVDVAGEYLAGGFDPLEGIVDGLIPGMQEASRLYEEEEYYIPELLICSDAMYNGLGVLRPQIAQDSIEQKGKVVIGVVQGDTHDIGKNLVKIMLETAGYQVYDLGRDVPAEAFIAKIKEVDADILAMSTLMSTAMPYMGEIIKALEAEGLREKVKVIVGGAPISWAFAKKIGAEGYSANATDAVVVVNDMMAGKPVGPAA